MTAWLERREKIQTHTAYIRSQQGSDQTHTRVKKRMGPPLARTYLIKMTRYPSVYRVSFDDLALKYGAIDFQDALGDFIASCKSSAASAATIRAQGAETLIPFRAVPVYHKVKFVSNDQSDNNSEIIDVIHARPEHVDSQGRLIPARFDTAFVHSSHSERANRGEYQLVCQGQSNQLSARLSYCTSTRRLSDPKPIISAYLSRN